MLPLRLKHCPTQQAATVSQERDSYCRFMKELNITIYTK